MSQIAFVFPGQGSQSIGMLADFAEEKTVQDVFAAASDALQYDLWKLASSGPEEEINKTELTQPVLLTASIALWRLWQERNGSTPAYLAGHSLGEYSALVASDSLQLEDAVKLVSLRGQLMQSAVPSGEGLMAAILGLSDDEVGQACEKAAQGDVVSAVNFNAPGQVVIAGSRAAVERAIDACKEAGAKRAMPLSVSVPSHCALMKPAAEKLADALAGVEIAAPSIPLVNNVDVAVTSEPAEIKDALVRQLHSPVRWVETVQFLASNEVTTLVECGPGKVLSGLAKRIDRSVSAAVLQDAAGFEKALS